MLLAMLLCGALAFALTGLIVRFARDHTRDHPEEAPQRFHWGHVPRLGGVAMLAAFTGGILALQAVDWPNVTHGMHPYHVAAFLGCTVVATLVGAYEDLTQRLTVRWRLLFTFMAASIAVWGLDLTVTRVGWEPLDRLLSTLPWLGIAVALVAVAGLPHAFNLIDGYNGLAGLVALVVSLALAYVCLQVGDRQLSVVSLMLVGATGGFLLWNYPRGLVFAGDGGAYLWGTVVAMLCLLLVQRHPQVSPWFPMLLLIYPVWETLFSIYRKLVRGQSPGVADALHFHQLIYRRIVRGVFHDDESRRMLMRNNRTSPYLWGFTVLTVIPAVVFWRYSAPLAGFCLLFIVTYVAAYFMIVRFKVPPWLRR